MCSRDGLLWRRKADETKEWGKNDDAYDLSPMSKKRSGVQMGFHSCGIGCISHIEIFALSHFDFIAVMCFGSHVLFHMNDSDVRCNLASRSDVR